MKAAVLFGVALASLMSGAAVSDFTRTVISTKLNGWEGVQFIKWEKTISDDNCGRGWAVKVDLSKGYRLRSQLGDANGNKATVGTMAETIYAAEGVAPIMGMNADYFDTSVSYARPTGIVITEDKLATAGTPNNAGPEMCYMMQTADNNLIHSKMVRNPALPSGYPTASWQVSAPGGKKIRQAVRTNYCNYPVKAGKMNPVANPISTGGATFPTTIGNMQHRTKYPRPLIGITTNGVGQATMLMMFLNDGRQGGWSTNFPDVVAYQIMIDEGCSEVGEFDGGGSAAMWMANGSESVYNFGTTYATAHGNYVNKPSDGWPRKDACGIFLLPPKQVDWTVEVNSGNLYATLDGALEAVAPGDAVAVRGATTMGGGAAFPRSCTVASAGTTVATVACSVGTGPTVQAGARVLFRDVAFQANAKACPLTVASGAIAAVSGEVGVEKIVTADAAGFEVAGALTKAVVVECAASSGAWQTFGKSALSPEAVAASLQFVRHPSDRTLVAAARSGANGTELFWKVGVTIGGSSDEAGFNYTNRTFSVTVNAVDGEFAAGTKLRLTVRDAAGTEVSSLDSDLAGAGVYSFDTGTAPGSTMCAGMNYTYETSLVDAQGKAIAGAESARGSFQTATDANWFVALAAGDSVSGGSWQTKPEIKDQTYNVTSGTTFAFLPTETKGGILQVTTEARFFGGLPEIALAEQCERYATKPPQSALTIRENDDETLSWVGLVREGDRPVYKELVGVAAKEDRVYRCRQEVDYSLGAPRVSYLVAPEGGEFVRMADATGAIWFAGPDANGTCVSRVELEGVANVKGVTGCFADKSIVRINGQEIVLLTNVILDPTTVEPGSYTVTRGGHAFLWTDNGRSVTYDGKTGALKVSATAPQNGYASYVSYVLNMDADDADSKPVATFVQDEKTGKTKIKLMLANGEEFQPRQQAETGYAVSVALESADNLGFAGSETGAKCAPEQFEPEVGQEASPARFYRCRIFLDR